MSHPAPLTIYLRIDLEQDVVLSNSAASSGLHQTLDYIPGGVLLGVAASAYATIEARDPNLAWSVFHAGGVRFGNGLPLGQGEAFVPLPASLRQSKAHEKGGFRSVSGSYLRPELRYRRRTAINPATGRALDMALFGYSSICAGQSFISRIDIAAGCAEVEEALLSALTAAPVWIGRSRGAEYGRVRITRSDAAPSYPTHGAPTGKQIRFLLLSDCACVGPELPAATMLGLPGSWAAASDTRVAWRRYAPFNFHRRAFDPERVVLEQGSVLVFEGPPLNAAEQSLLLATLDAGLGRFCGEGLGVALANTALIELSPPAVVGAALQAQNSPPPSDEDDVVIPEDPLFQWLLERHAEWLLGSLARAEAARYERSFADLYRELWREGRLAGRSPNEAAPSRAQWGSVREEGLHATSFEALRHRLLSTEEGVCSAGTGGASWRQEARLRGMPTSAASLLDEAIDLPRLEQALDREQQPHALAAALARLIIADLAVQIPRMMEELERQPA